MFVATGPTQASIVIYDSGDNGTANGGLLLGIAPETLQALGSGIVTGQEYTITSIGVYVQSITENGALDLLILPATTYQVFDDTVLPDPLDLLTSSFTVRLESLTTGLNSAGVNWELPAGLWFVAAVPVIDTPGLHASLSGALTPAASNGFYGNNPFWLPDEGTFPSFVLLAIPEPGAACLLLLSAGVLATALRKRFHRCW